MSIWRVIVTPTIAGRMTYMLESLSVPERLDLRNICLDSERVKTSVCLYDCYFHEYEWAMLGRIKLAESKFGQQTAHRLDAPMPALDFEHDRASCFSIRIGGLTLGFMTTECTVWHGYIVGNDSGDFRVPLPNYNPMATAKPCKECKGKNKHLIVGEGCYVPNANQEVFDLVRGKPVTIRIYNLPVNSE